MTSNQTRFWLLGLIAVLSIDTGSNTTVDVANQYGNPYKGHPPHHGHALLLERTGKSV